ncbi:GERMIN-LIKE PROTEIN SUBFAMILY 3 MEMBER 4 [Salix viminalis]|uniref:Germin-like protein n=1 Tax=Salix viminalis TaxID=40686 RepID=A0A9Q0SGB7_SALVM|nr:GERMIN-LIKE PROTEIN SUBFAMILY 3 MEMBER 4 [Salix viminalis]
MNSTLFFCIFLSTCIDICLSDSDNLQDTCPTATTGKQTVFINGFPCKNPNSIVASDFKSSKLSRPGLNTLGLSIARTDLEVNGLMVPHSHPRASEMFFVSTGVVIAGFIDTQTKLFQKTLKAGEVFVFPQGLLHFCINDGFNSAVVFSVLNSQNPGVVKIADAIV